MLSAASLLRLDEFSSREGAGMRSRTHVTFVAAVLLVVLLLPGCAYISRVSESSSGVGGDGSSESSGISADGRWTVFESLSTNLVPGDTNGVSDVFVRDNQGGAVVRVSVSIFGDQADGASTHASI